jgi:hypothetical protein
MMGTMTEQPAPQQLSLLPPAEVPVQFRIDEATRRRGMRHIAEIRAQLAARQAERQAVFAAVTQADRPAA